MHFADVLVSGDLRDVDDFEDFENWLTRISKDFRSRGIVFRNGCFQAEVENDAVPRIYFVQDGTWLKAKQPDGESF
jgi:hypothetical protein